RNRKVQGIEQHGLPPQGQSDAGWWLKAESLQEDGSSAQIRAQISMGMESRRRNASPGISHGYRPIARSRRAMTILIGTPVQKAGHATARPSFTDDMFEA